MPLHQGHEHYNTKRMDTNKMETAQGHWILAKMGKRVLRPGGKELTQRIFDALRISSDDNVVEFAPGIGFTASKIVALHPRSYVGIDADRDVVDLLSRKLAGKNVKFKLAHASETNLAENSIDKVMGEAMLTMHNDERKSEIIREAHRILKKGGIYAIHELGLKDVDDKLKNEINRDLQLTIKVHARPLTAEEWSALLEKEGFVVKEIFTNEMHLLETRRIVDDEGFFRTLKIAFNILTNKSARERILAMRSVFRRNQKHLNAVAILAEKI